MTTKSQIIWSLKELAETLRQRQKNKFDCNIGVSGLRGNGKSTFIFKLLNSFKKEGFNQNKHQVYSREDVVKLLSNQTFSFCWDDEAINSGYKRDFQNKGQQDLIKIITNYRDSFNMYASALPFFYTLDKGLRELIFLHVHIIERGFAVLLMPLEDGLHSQDPWDTKANVRIEEKENKLLEKNPDHKFRYHKLTTFAGYIYFGDMTEKQKKRYAEIKRIKRAKAFEKVVEDKEKSWIQRMYDLIIQKKISNQSLLDLCLLEGKKYSAICTTLNQMLRDHGEKNTLSHYLFVEKKEDIHNSIKTQLNDLIPDF